MILQAEIIERAWNIQPEYVYGFLVAVLLVGMYILATFVKNLLSTYKQSSDKYTEEIKELHKKTIEAITKQNVTMQQFAEYIKKKERMYDVITSMSDRVAKNIKIQEEQNKDIEEGFKRLEINLTSNFVDALKRFSSNKGSNEVF